MFESIDSLISKAEATWWRAEIAHPVGTQSEAGERIQEIADRYVPVYTVDLLKLAEHDVDLATTEPTLEGVLQTPLSATALIARNVFAVITDHLWGLYYVEIAAAGHRDAA